MHFELKHRREVQSAPLEQTVPLLGTDGVVVGLLGSVEGF